MKVTAISDIHIRSNHDNGMDTIVNFLNHEDVVSSNEIYLLGDIFDNIAGSFKEYYEKYSRFFEALIPHLRKKTRVYYVEGNHDVHLDELFQKFLKKQRLDPSLIRVNQKGFELLQGDKNIYLSHGDEYDIQNKTYKRWKRFLISWPVGFVIENFVSFNWLDKFSRKASDDSKVRNEGRDSEEAIRQKFRTGATLRFEQGFDIVVGGHSHVKDFYEISGHLYINDGFPQKDKCFISIENGSAKFICF